MKLAGMHLASADHRVDADDLNIDFDGWQAPDLRGQITVSLGMASVDVAASPLHVMAEGVALHAHGAFVGRVPRSFEVDVPVGRLRAFAPGSRQRVDAPARVQCRVDDLEPDAVDLAASRGVVRLGVDVGDVHSVIEVTKSSDAADFAIRAAAASLKAARPFLSPALAKEAWWDRMGMTLRSNGHVDHLRKGALTLRQTTDVTVDRPEFGGVAGRSLSLTLASRGTALVEQLDADLHAQGLSLEGGSAVDDHVTLSATVDRTQPSLHVQLTTDGRSATKMSAALSFDPSRRALAYEIEANLAGLAPIAPLAAKVHGLDAFELSGLDVAFSARGALVGVVAGVGSDGAIAIEPNPMRTAAVDGKVDVTFKNFGWSKAGTAVHTPSFSWHGDMHNTEGRRTLESRVEVGTLHVDVGSRALDINGFADDASIAVVGNLLDPEVELSQRLLIRAVEQTIVPEYPIGDVAFALSAERSPDGVVHISDMKLANGLAGTTLALTGNVDLGDGRRALSVTTSMTQDIERLSTAPERFKGRGTVAAEASVTSPDFAHYHVRAAVKGENVNVNLARAGFEVEAANGEVPITVALVVGPSGIALERSEKRSPYSMLRFADQHPLLSRSGFLSIARLKTPHLVIAPLVGNLEVDQNVVSLRQFEMGVRGGSITGQCGLDWDGAKSTLELHVRASGVQSSHGEPFDGNIAVAISAADRTIDGRAEILRIGERHLLDLLDLQDPLHVDPAMNRIRTALFFGYPDSLRLIFDHGFASAHLELGGLARLVSIGELRGIPMGPIVDKMLAPMLVGLSTEETP
jgi:hypothetical protein